MRRRSSEIMRGDSKQGIESVREGLRVREGERGIFNEE
jgi:hypothetical protein